MSIDPFCLCDEMYRGAATKKHNTLVFAVNFAIHCGISIALTFGDLYLYFSCDVVVLWYKTFIYALRTCGLRVGGWARSYKT